MRQTLSLLPAIAIATLLVATTEAKPPKPQNQPATLAFQCAFSTDPDDPCPAGFVPDGIRGDTVLPYTALLDLVGEANMTLAPGGGRFLWLDFRNGPARLPGDRRHFDTLMLNSVIFHTNMVDANGNEVAGGLRSLQVGQSSDSRLKIAFNTVGPTGEIAWAVRFNPAYAGSDLITVRRLSATTWEIEATAADRAVLVSGLRRTLLIEGPFTMPFKALLTSPPTS